MKRLISAVLCSSAAAIVFGQYLEFDAARIPVFERPFALKSDKEAAIDTIRQSFGQNDEEWYDFTIMESSALRFKIRYRLSEECLLWIESESKPPFKEGWIDKKYMRVRISSVRNAKDDDCFDFRLYSKPCDDSPEFVFTFYYEEKERVDLPVTEVGDDGWLKVMFFFRGKYYEGWTRDYCNEFYTTCT